MKTLDEVITGMTELVLSGKTKDVKEVVTDALKFLKEFRGLLKMWNDKLDKEKENNPLTWEELRQMEGKPVFIDSRPLVRRWVIIKKFHPIGGNKNLFDMEVEDGAHFLRKNMRKDDPAWWLAYRKEK